MAGKRRRWHMPNDEDLALLAGAYRRSRFSTLDNGPARAVTGYGLAAVRKRRGLTRVELVNRLRLLQSAVSRFERQDDALVSTLARYVDGLGLPVAAVRRDDIRPDSQRPVDERPPRRSRR